MNRSKLILIVGVSLLALCVPSGGYAQAVSTSGPFADVPADHWAYQSVDTLQKAGIVIGYPNGTYGGRRALTRYEFAVAIARLFPLLNSPNDYATKDDLAAQRQQLESELQANSDAIAALQKLVDEFTPELQKLGQDIAGVQDRLSALEARVAVVEAEQQRVKINGWFNEIAKGFSVTKGYGMYDQNGNGFTADDSSGGSDYAKKILNQTNVYNDFILGIMGKVGEAATANVKLDFGNYLSAIGNTVAPGFDAGSDYLSTADSGFGYLGASFQQTTVWEANLDAPISLGGQFGKADLTAGRFGNQWTNYTLMQPDADVYTKLAQLDDGNIPTDGAKVTFGLGSAKINAWAGQTKAIPFAQPWVGATTDYYPTDYSIRPAVVGIYKDTGVLPTGLLAATHAAPVLQGAGVRATFGNPDNGVLGVSVEQFGLGDHNGDPGPSIGNQPEDPNSDKDYGILSVYGVDFNGAIPVIGKCGLTLAASWTDSAEATGSQNFDNVGNNWRYQETDDELGYSFGALSLKGGYRYIGPNFTAPGSWGRVGAWINPANVEGGVASAKYVFSPKANINADYEGYQAAYGADQEGNDENSPLLQGDKVDRYQAGVAYDFSKNDNLNLGYEADEYNLQAQTDVHPAGKPTQTWLTLGVGHTFNNNASFNVLYQIIQYRDKGTNFDGDQNYGTGFDSNGDVAVGQFSLKF